jgi:cbb3-type cytochrome c oxidase subunit II
MKELKERFVFIFLVAGIGFFLLGFLFQILGPLVFLRKIPMKTIAQLAEAGPRLYFEKLADDYPEEFKKAFGEPTVAAYAEALRLGRDTYIADGCWHCHSQYVRPVANEPLRYGAVSVASEYQNALQLPQLFGTRRVGPDLIREGGVRSNDWHVAHFYDPTSVQPGSVMPSYRWFFDENGRPNKKGLAMVAYVQWLGSGQEGKR